VYHQKANKFLSRTNETKNHKSQQISLSNEQNKIIIIIFYHYMYIKIYSTQWGWNSSVLPISTHPVDNPGYIQLPSVCQVDSVNSHIGLETSTFDSLVVGEQRTRRGTKPTLKSCTRLPPLSKYRCYRTIITTYTWSLCKCSMSEWFEFVKTVVPVGIFYKNEWIDRSWNPLQ
jgi:hypothetical protein